jgi:hypothetical protein
MHRGFGGTRFLPADTPRTGNTGVLALDGIELMDVLRIERYNRAVNLATVNLEWT